MDKRIFKFNDGSSDVYGDPFEIDYRFSKAIEEANEDTDLLDRWIGSVQFSEDGQTQASRQELALHFEACHRYVPLIRRAFSLPDFDPKTGSGLTGTEILKLWASYCDWQEEVKKNTESPPTSAPPTDSTPPS